MMWHDINDASRMGHFRLILVYFHHQVRSRANSSCANAKASQFIGQVQLPTLLPLSFPGATSKPQRARCGDSPPKGSNGRTHLHVLKHDGNMRRGRALPI